MLCTLYKTTSAIIFRWITLTLTLTLTFRAIFVLLHYGVMNGREHFCASLEHTVLILLLLQENNSCVERAVDYQPQLQQSL